MDHISRDTVQAIALRLVLAAVGMTSVLRSRMELASPITAVDSIADAAFLHAANSSLDIAGSSPSILIFLTRLTRAAELPAVFLNAMADVISSSCLHQLALRVGFPSKEATNISTMFLWNPLTIATCVSGSADPLKLAGVFAAATAAASGHPAASGAALAFALHLSSPHTILLVIPLIMLATRRASKGNQVKCIGVLVAGFIGFSTVLTILGGIFMSGSLIRTLLALPRICMHSIYDLLGVGHSLPGNGVLHNYDLIALAGGGGGGDVARDVFPSTLIEPWSNITPNIGLLWYLFAEIFPIFRYSHR